MFDITAVRPSIYAAIFTFISCLIGIISFVTPYWLASDGRAPIRRFNNLGLWEVCFESFEDPHYRYDLVYRGCRWIFDEDFYFLSYFLRPPFFVATQTLYTLGFTFLLIAAIGVLAIQLCFVIDKEMYAMRALSIIMFLSALFCTTACIIFGIKGDDRDWMPDPEHNYLSWSFALAVVGCFFQWMASILFWIENRTLYKKELKKHSNSFDMEPTSIKS